MDYFVILVNIVVTAVLFLIIVYCWLDRKRFHLEAQFRAVRPLFDRWMEQASDLPDCADFVAVYKKTRNVSAKYRAIGEVNQIAWGRETAEMKKIAGELHVFLGVYQSMAEEYNRRLNSKFTGKVAALLGFKKFPNLQLETDNVQN